MIEMKDLTVQFRNGTKAISNINMKIESGIYGLLGENGAGKTTLMRVLTTILKPTHGQVVLNNIELTDASYVEIQKIIGYLPQELGLYPGLTVRDSLEYMGGLAGLKKNECNKRIDYYLEKTSLTSHQKKKNRQLSGGMKRRVGLVQAMLHDPQILIVDEPTTGLDPEERIRIRNLLVDFSKNRIVLFSTHVVEDLAVTCNTLAILRKGELIYDGNIANLLEQAKEHVWMCKLQSDEQLAYLQQRFKLSTKQHTQNGIEVKIISDKKPEIPCRQIDATLEDAYIDIMNKLEQ